MPWWRHGAPVGGRRLGRADVHAAVHLHGVDGDDLGAGDGARGGHRDVGLARRRRAEDDDRRGRQSSERGDGDARAVRGLGDELDEAAR